MEQTYVVKRVAEVDWEQIPAVELEHTGWLESCAIAAKAQACHDGENLWIRMEAKEAPIRATLTGKLDAICTDSCLEFFFAPDPELPHYFNFEFNPLAALYLGFGAERATRVRQIVRDVNVSFAPKPFFTENGWGIEYKIPRSFLFLQISLSAAKKPWKRLSRNACVQGSRRAYCGFWQLQDLCPSEI